MFEEDQKFSFPLFLGVCVFIIVMAIIVSWSVPNSEWLQTFLGVSSPVILVLLLHQWFRLRTTVSDSQLSVKLRPFGGADIALGDIQSAEVITYHPLKDFGGWGIRMGTKGWIYNARGNQAVKLDVKDRGTIFIGSQMPKKLLAVLSNR